MEKGRVDVRQIVIPPKNKNGYLSTGSSINVKWA
jgi:hypothetical protein